MYFLEKLCRICVQAGAPLVNIDTVDFDSVCLSEKLEVCAKMAISKDIISSDICEKCVNKLRVSYHFLDMCKKSTKIIQGYLEKLVGTENAEKHRCDNFKNNELNAVVEKLPNVKLESLESSLESEEQIEHNENETKNHHTLSLLHAAEHRIRPCRKKQRITKEQRCSLLKRLLNRPRKERDKPVYPKNSFGYERGGLKNIIDFAKNYEFSFKLDKNSNIESTPLDKLTAFSTNYFRRDFTEFKNHILYIIENRDRFECCSMYSTDEDDFMSESDIGDEYEEGGGVEFEEVMVEPDMKIKSEVMDCEEEESQCPLDYLETSFEEEDIKIKKEGHQSDSEKDLFHHKPDRSPVHNLQNFFHSTTSIKEEDSLANNFSNIVTNSIDPFGTIQPTYKSSLSINSSPAVKLLDKLVSTYPMGSRKVFSASNVRCRTRDQPYINPQLKDQFLFRSFRCERCNRYFKSQGYLKAHASKVH